MQLPSPSDKLSEVPMNAKDIHKFKKYIYTRRRRPSPPRTRTSMAMESSSLRSLQDSGVARVEPELVACVDDLDDRHLKRLRRVATPCTKVGFEIVFHSLLLTVTDENE